MRILGIDHATRNAGFAVYRDNEFFDFGPIQLSAEHPQVVAELYREVRGLIDEYEPDVVALEKPMAQRGGDVTRKLTEMYTACLLAALEGTQGATTVIEITPQQAKMFVGCNGNAEKDDVARALQLNWHLQYDDIAIPVHYATGKKKGHIKTRLYDVSDACALCIAADKILAERMQAQA